MSVTYFKCWCPTLIWKTVNVVDQNDQTCQHLIVVTRWQCHQHISSRTSVTNIDVTKVTVARNDVSLWLFPSYIFFKSKIKHIFDRILMIYEKIKTMFLKRFSGDLDEIILRRFTATFYRVFTTLFTALWHALSDIKIHIFIQDIHRR